MNRKLIIGVVLILCTTITGFDYDKNTESNSCKKNTVYVADFDVPQNRGAQPNIGGSNDLVNNQTEVSRGNNPRMDIKARIIAKIDQRDEEFNETTPDDVKNDIANTIIGECKKYDGADPILIAAIIDVESKFRIYSESNAGATGIMQIIPSTAEYIAEEMGMKSYDLGDYKTCIKMGIYYYMEDCVDAWAYDAIEQKNPKTNIRLTKYQMGLMTYNGNTRTARKLSNIEYMYAVEEAMTKI